MKKYKLVQYYPNSPPIGTIVELPEETVERHYSHLYVPYLFTTEDGVDKYEKDSVITVNKQNLEIVVRQYVGEPANTYFWYFNYKSNAKEFVDKKQALRKKSLFTKEQEEYIVGLMDEYIKRRKELWSNIQ